MPPATGLTIRRITPEDGMLLRELRLRSIADAPRAFGQPLEEAAARPDVEWHRSARQSSHGDHRTWLIAETDGVSCGLVQGRRRRPATLLLFSMWVDPTIRRIGAGSALIAVLEAWGRGWNAKEIVLWVFGANKPASDFYRELGFTPIRDGEDAEAGARFAAVAMRRDIHSPGALPAPST